MNMMTAQAAMWIPLACVPVLLVLGGCCLLVGRWQAERRWWKADAEADQFDLWLAMERQRDNLRLRAEIYTIHNTRLAKLDAERRLTEEQHEAIRRTLRQMSAQKRRAYADGAAL